MATPRPSLTSAVLLMLAAVLLFALMDAGLKLLSSQYPPLQVAALRGLSSLPLVTLWVLATVPARSLLRVHWPLHLLRGALGIAMMAGFVYGLRTMPLSTAYAITSWRRCWSRRWRVHCSRSGWGRGAGSRSSSVWSACW